MPAEPLVADLHLPWLDYEVPAGSIIEELRVWQHEDRHHDVGEAAAGLLVELADGTEVFRIRHVRHGHETSQPPYSGEGRADYLVELEALWVAFNHDANLTTDDVDSVLAALTSLEATGSIDGVSA